MKLGTVFPQTEAGTDLEAIKEYALAVESLGFEHVIAFDHVLGANSNSRSNWSGAYNHTDSFLEPFALFGFLAGITQKLELATGIIILPQRQTALVAKQAATIDILSGGRLRLGVGTGWNQVEYEALGQDFSNRGERSEEQIKLMRKLWKDELVTFGGKFHKITDAGLNPLPLNRSIPIWFGGSANPVLKRIARIGDGWIPTGKPDSTREKLLDTLARYMNEQGRKIDDIGIESWVSYNDFASGEMITNIEKWRTLGATHLSINTMNCGMKFPDEHIKAIGTFKEVASN